MTRAEYLSAARDCATVNQFNRLHIDLENVMAPLDFAEVSRWRGDPQLPAETQDWLRSIERLDQSIFRAPQRYVGRPVLEHAVLYEDASIARSDKGIMIGFCGGMDRLGVPIAAFLQSLDLRSWDVVKVTRERGRSYFHGWGAGDIGGVVDSVASAVDVGAYRRIVCIGVSAGGLPAVVAGRLLGADTVVAIGARYGESIDEATQGSDGTHAAPRFVLVHGALNANDTAAAAALQSVIGGELLAIADAERHNLVLHLLKAGRLPDFLEDVFNPPTRPAMRP